MIYTFSVVIGCEISQKIIMQIHTVSRKCDLHFFSSFCLYCLPPLAVMYACVNTLNSLHTVCVSPV